MNVNRRSQEQEVAVKFARDAINLIERGKSSDVCARKLVAAAAVMHGRLGGEAEIDEKLREELFSLQLRVANLLNDAAAVAEDNRKLRERVAELECHAPGAGNNALRDALNMSEHNTPTTLKP